MIMASSNRLRKVLPQLTSPSSLGKDSKMPKEAQSVYWPQTVEKDALFLSLKSALQVKAAKFSKNDPKISLSISG